MTYLLDTNILLNIIRKAELAESIRRQFDFDNPRTILLLSIVSEGEIRSISIRNKWEAKKISQMQIALSSFAIIPIESRDLILRYAEIDAFSQGKLEEKTLPDGLSARNMGKNDLWIAATASVLGAKLLTTDADFDHLAQTFLDIEKIA
jgi:predicted nucleic acid-binding protein